MAQQLGVDLTTVTRAFDEARKRGLIEARGPQGSFIAPPKAGFDQVVDLSMNVPPVPDADALAETLRRGAAAVLARSNAPNLMTYHLGGGNPTDRHAAARWLQPMLGTVNDACLLLTEGAQVALAAILLSQGRDGDAILCDALVYPACCRPQRRLAGGCCRWTATNTACALKRWCGRHAGVARGCSISTPPARTRPR